MSTGVMSTRYGVLPPQKGVLCVGVFGNSNKPTAGNSRNIV